MAVEECAMMHPLLAREFPPPTPAEFISVLEKFNSYKN